MATAETFLASGEFCWNSGIFVWSLSNIQAAFEAHLPDMLADFADADLSTPKLNAVYGNCENISIDYGIMEKASQVQVVLCDIGWSDLGTWGSLKDKLDTRRPRERRGQRGAARRRRQEQPRGGHRPARRPKNSWR